MMFFDRSLAASMLLGVDALFPFNLPAATAFYVSLYLLTWVVHVVFMNYVLAGSAYLAAATLLAKRSAGTNSLAELLRDWMPFMLSAAITAGIAPLLFAQILYPNHFYTANLLLFHRWMAVLPVLIIGFYVLYLLKSKLAENWSLTVRGLVGGGALACFAFIAWSWTENHLLSLAPDDWPQRYASGQTWFASRQLLPRLATWFTGAFFIMAVVLGWQLWFQHRRTAVRGLSETRDAAADSIPGSRRTSALALAGLVLSAVCGALYIFELDNSAHPLVITTSVKMYGGALCIGAAVQATGWVYHYIRARLTRNGLLLISAAAGVQLVSAAALREMIRHSAIDLPALHAQHQEAATIGGFRVFALFLVVNTLLIAFSIRLVRSKNDAARAANGGT